MYFYSKKKQLILVILGMFALLGIIRFGGGLNKNRMLLSMNFCNDYVEVVQGCIETEDLEIKDVLKFNGCTVPYAAATNTFYISQDTSTENWGGYFSTLDSCEVYFKSDEMWQNKSAAISSNYLFSILIKKDNQYREANLVVSGIPVLALTEQEFGKPLKFSLLDADEETSYEGFCRSHQRGQTSTVNPKFGYKVVLCDEKQKPVKAPLLGLRNDDDWILNPLYGDSSKIREKMAYQIWDDMQEYNQTKNKSSNITHVELILNNIYWGIYGLQEPVDKLQLSMNETDVYYRKTDILVPTAEDFAAIEDGQEYTIGFRVKYPKVEDIKTSDWEPLEPYVKYFYKDIYEPVVEVPEIETLTDLVDLDNAIDYKIFIAVIGGEDNIFKNVNYCMRYENGGYKAYMIPWDLNMSFGDVGMGANAEYRPEYEKSDMSSREYITLYRSDNELIERVMREKWKDYRQHFLREEYLRAMAEDYMEELAASGAMIRDNTRWPECQNSADLSELYSYIDHHMVCLDERYNKTEWWRENELLRREDQCIE